MMSAGVITVFVSRGSRPGHGAYSVTRNRLIDCVHHTLAEATVNEHLAKTRLQQQPQKPPEPGKPPVEPPGPGKPPVEPPEPDEPPVEPPGPDKPPLEPPADAPIYTAPP